MGSKIIFVGLAGLLGTLSFSPRDTTWKRPIEATAADASDGLEPGKIVKCDGIKYVLGIGSYPRPMDAGGVVQLIPFESSLGGIQRNLGRPGAAWLLV